MWAVHIRRGHAASDIRTPLAWYGGRLAHGSLHGSSVSPVRAENDDVVEARWHFLDFRNRQILRRIRVSSLHLQRIELDFANGDPTDDRRQQSMLLDLNSRV